MRMQAGQHLDFSLVNPWAEGTPIWMLTYRNYEMMNGFVCGNLLGSNRKQILFNLRELKLRESEKPAKDRELTSSRAGLQMKVYFQI